MVKDFSILIALFKINAITFFSATRYNILNIRNLWGTKSKTALMEVFKAEDCK